MDAAPEIDQNVLTDVCEDTRALLEADHNPVTREEVVPGKA